MTPSRRENRAISAVGNLKLRDDLEEDYCAPLSSILDGLADDAIHRGDHRAAKRLMAAFNRLTGRKESP